MTKQVGGNLASAGKLLLAALLGFALAVAVGFTPAARASLGQDATPIVAVTATPAGDTPGPGETDTAVLSATVTPAPTLTSLPTVSPSASPTATPAVAAWTTPEPPGLLPGGPLILESPIVKGALIGVGAIIVLVILFLIVDAVRRRRGGGPAEVEEAPEEEQSLVLAGPVILANRYVLVEEIGKGALGTVYRAVDSILNRSVAIKVVRGRELRRAMDEGRPAGEGLFFEAQTTAQLKHPNIVVIHDVREWGDDIPLYVVMEFLEGTPLQDVLEQQAGQPLDDELTLQVATSVLKALAHAHSQGVVHRDLKPANIMLLGAGPDLQVKVLDFGLAYRAQDLQTVPYSLREGNLVGTPSYMSPEQIRGERPGEPADLYALGVLLFYMVTGQLPYTGLTPKEIALKHLQAPIPDPRAFRVDLREEVVQLLMHLLHKDPRRRPASATESLQVLQALDGTLSLTALREARSAGKQPGRE